MSNNLHFITQDEEPTMAPPASAPAYASKIIAPFFAKIPAHKKIIFGGKTPKIVTKSVTVPAFRKRNGTLVAAHTRLVHLDQSKSNVKSPKKITPYKNLKPSAQKRHMLKFSSPQERCPSASLAHSIRIAELQKLLHPEREV
jgi:hypothetical protein